ncbi:hypothetical protein KOR34_39230 [Posidoniimonas corsicana]|uniref:Uncharacterized protein n=1 Tax=Posidoniimonas corsicana TaxID=1938618 RepID=A0A5C5V8B8_9BACT|nr:hypothetical protein [Posidoniimonas corsicana]TWT34087.1 hypothetical protein KOR34_39230 [Posidoniimonas corsicana]
MNPANVKSTDAILAVKAAVAGFAKQSSDGLDELTSEIRRTVEWLEHDRPAYWKERVRRAYDKVGEAKDDLQRCLTFQASESHRPSCTEQRVALRRAQEFLKHCQEKQARVKHWNREVAHELHEYHGRVAGLRTVVEADAPAAIAVLERLVTAIEEYNAGSVGGSVGGQAVEKIEADDATNEPPKDE